MEPPSFSSRMIVDEPIECFIPTTNNWLYSHRYPSQSDDLPLKSYKLAFQSQIKSSFFAFAAHIGLDRP